MHCGSHSLRLALLKNFVAKIITGQLEKMLLRIYIFLSIAQCGKCTTSSSCKNKFSINGLAHSATNTLMTDEWTKLAI